MLLPQPGSQHRHWEGAAGLVLACGSSRPTCHPLAQCRATTGCEIWRAGIGRGDMMLLARVLGQQRPDWGHALSALLPMATPNRPDQERKDQQNMQGPRKLRRAWLLRALRSSRG